MIKTVSARNVRFLLRVETSHEPEDYRKYEDLRNEIWGFPDDHLAGTRNMMCENFFHEGGSLFIGAFAEAPGRGFAADGAGPGRDSVTASSASATRRSASATAANLRFYSQFAGVRPAFQSFGLGILLKEFQREVVLGAPGVSTIICTYDPLTGVNAHPQRPPFRHGGPRIPCSDLRRVRRAAQPARRPHGPLPDVLGPRGGKWAGAGPTMPRRGCPADHPGRHTARGGEDSELELEAVGGIGPESRGRCPARPDPAGFLPDAPGNGRGGRRRSGGSPSTGGWPPAGSSWRSSAAATGSSTSSRRPARARQPLRPVVGPARR